MLTRAFAFVVASILFAPILALAAAESGPNTPDAATLSARAAAASAMPSAYTETIETVEGDYRLTKTVYRNADGERVVEGGGPHHTEHGIYRGDPWHQNENGLTVLDDPGPPETPNALTTTVTSQASPVPAYVLSKTEADGFGTRQYIDPETYRVFRVVRHTVNGDVTTNYDDFRRTGTGTSAIAYHWTIDDGIRMLKTDERIVRFTPTRPGSADVAIPPLRRSLVEFPAGTQRVELPVHFNHTDIVVKVMIGGRSYDFLLDTGAGSLFIDTSVAKELGLAARAVGVSTANAGKYAASTATLPELKVGPLTMRDVVVAVGPMPESPTQKAAGLLGFDFLATLGLTIDYQNARVWAVPGAQYQPPAGSPRIPLDVRLGEQVPMTTIHINGAEADHVVIDTGAETTLAVFNRFAQRNRGALYDYRGMDAEDPYRMFSGVGGNDRTVPYTIKDITIGPLHFANFLAFQNTAKGAYSSIDGLFGGQFLQFFTLGVDFPDGRIDLVPNGHGHEAMGR